MTIFVHGTIKPAEVSLSTINKIMRNKIENSLYSLSVGYMRANSQLYQNGPMQGLGLLYIDPLDDICKSGAQTIRALFEMEYAFYHKNPPQHRYYTFGWSGLLNMKKRYEDAKKFYHDLEKEVTLLRSQNLEPQIQIIAYSHGGNVALNLAKVKKNTIIKPHFTIEKLILLATPIQKETDHLIEDTAFFKKVYLFYSTEDHVQSSDFFSTQKELFSHYRFTRRSNFKPPNTLTQVRFRLTRRINRSSKINNTKATPQEILEEPSIRCIHMDPGHGEFWSLQWGSCWYRQRLPISPLPVISLIPAILYLLEHFAPAATKITFDYCPSVHGARLIRKKGSRPIAVPVLNEAIINNMKEVVKKCIPDNFSLKEQEQHEKLALKQAHEALKKNKKIKKSTREKLTILYFDLSRKIWPHHFPKF